MTLLVEDTLEYNGWTYNLVVEHKERRDRRHSVSCERRRGKLYIEGDTDDYPANVSSRFSNTVYLEEEVRKWCGLKRARFEDIEPEMSLEEQVADLIEQLEHDWYNHEPLTLDELFETQSLYR